MSANIITGREVVFLRFEPFEDDPPTLKDFSVVFEVLEEEWDDANLQTMEEEGSIELQAYLRTLKMSRRPPPAPWPSVAPKRVHYGSPLDILIAHKELLSGLVVPLAPVILGRWMDAIKRVAQFPYEVREARATAEMAAKEAEDKKRRVERRRHLAEMEDADRTIPRSPKDQARRNKMRETGLSLDVLAVLPEDEVPQ